MLTALEAPREEIQDLGRWVMAVAQRRAVDVVRRRSVTSRLLARMVRHDAGAEDPADAVVARHTAASAVARLTELPASTLAVVHGIAGGASLAGVAADLGMSYRAAESHVTRARRWARRASAG